VSAGPTAGGLSAEELELLAMLLDEAGIESEEPEAIRPRDPGRRVPLTFGQRRLWFLEQLEPENRIYNDVLGLRIGGPLDAGALRRAIDAIVERHEVLRTVFPEVDGEPAQVVVPDMRLPFDTRDLSHLPPDELVAEVRRISDEMAHAPFDLVRGPLMRVLLAHLGDEDHALVLPIHHIVSDGWSMGVFFRELSTLYTAFHQGRPSPLPPLKVQYGDFAVWQEEHLAGGALERQIAYWKERLRGVPALLDLPVDRPRPAEQTYRGGSYNFLLPRDVSSRAQALAQREGATVFMFLLAALGALLARYTGEEDVVVGSPIASRTRPELEDVIGLFANTLPLRVDVSGDPTFRELLARVREGTFEDYANQDLPFERLVEELRIERSLSYNPLYQVMLVLQNTPRMGEPLPGLSMRPLETTHDTAKLDLSATMVETEQGIFGGWEYSTDLFDRETIVRLADHLAALLRGIVEDPDRRVSELPLIAPEERTRVLYTWNESVEDVFAAVPVHEQFEAQAEHAPDALAVWSRGEALTYGELSRRSSRLAHFLRARGVGPEARVGVCVERSPEMIVAVLGVLKAGGAYVPLDPQYPRERLAFLVEDSGIAVLLTQERLFADLPGSASADVVFLDADWERIAAEPDTAPESGVSPDNPAYLIYTSGSTGRPKGVVVPHRALAGFTGIACEAYGIGPDDAVLQFASINFDASAEEIFPALVSGARLVLRTEEMLDSPEAFLGACGEWGITVLDLPTAYWHELAAEAAGGDVDLPEALRLVIIGGERALPERLRDWRDAFGGGVRLVNSYGPTEATVVATMADLPAGGGEDGAARPPRHVPIGRPIRNTRAYVLDPRGEAVPIGVPGELHLGGGGVARGYLDRPDLTAGRFVPDPFGPEPGARVYRTGDRVRFLADGTLEFVGRVDQQVKVRGFRVELGEIESALAAQPGVAEAVVAAREESPGSSRLVAYLLAEPGAELSVPDLRAALKAELPGYMVPAAFAVLDAFPLTRSGKTDRRALPAPESVARAEAKTAAHAAPQSDVERAIAAAWQEVLGVEEVGLDDNFFDLGGHSLLLARVRSRLAGRFPREVSVVVLFRYPTVRSLAGYLAQGAVEEAVLPQRSEEEMEGRRAAMRRRRDLKKNLGG
jgi:amino acid adenylation domain-containing protein